MFKEASATFHREPKILSIDNLPGRLIVDAVVTRKVPSC